MIKKKTPTSLCMLTITLLIATTVYSIITIFITLSNPNQEEANSTMEVYIDATEPTELAEVTKQENAVTVPQALVDMSKPNPKPIYTRETLTPVEMLYKTSAKTYMDYRSITDKSSNQYNLIHSDKIEICEDGFLRDEEGYIGVAMGSKFGDIGSRYICHLDNGKSIKVIKVEAKANRDTVNGFCGSTSYDIIEFVIDTRAEWMRNNICGNDYIFCGNFNNYEEMNGTIISIDKVEN